MNQHAKANNELILEPNKITEKSERILTPEKQITEAGKQLMNGKRIQNR